ncbi:CPBP family intramembrane glutamic endopeptidase [Streptococcus equi]|uniref:CPBP family intramembrane glutamic endopeptidase n=1 Tax=Streptococcus equi TaxID=1336 RepID=UPI0013F661FF|nr:type II CAAX endopeptidase family protein [Streptococcus equi]
MEMIKRNRKSWQAKILYIAKLFVIITVLSLLAAVLSSVFLAFVGHLVPENSPSFRMWTNLTFVFTSLVMMIWVRYGEKVPLSSLGLTRKKALRKLAAGWGLGATFYTIYIGLMILFGHFQIASIQVNPQLLFQSCLWLLVWLVQSHAEEVSIRGWLFSRLSRELSVVASVVLSSLYFMILHFGSGHFDLMRMLDLFLFGIFACLVYLYQGSIWAISGFHAAWNFFDVTVFAPLEDGLSDSMVYLKNTSSANLDLINDGTGLSLVMHTLAILYLIHRIRQRKGV